MIGKSKIRFWLTIDRRVDNMIRKEAMKLGLSKSDYIRRAFYQYLETKGHNINNIINEPI